MQPVTTLEQQARTGNATFSRLQRRRLHLEVEMSAESEKKHVPWYLWPFWAIWQLIEFIFKLTGRLLAVVLGLVLMLAGALISLTVIGAIIGVPLFIVGLLLVFRGLF
jgi:hypothetical protein